MNEVNESDSGSALESVVQSQQDCDVASNPVVHGTPDLLAEIRARAMKEYMILPTLIKYAESKVATSKYKDKSDMKLCVKYYEGKLDSFTEVLQWLDDLGVP